jgi:hypothetical protein
MKYFPCIVANTLTCVMVKGVARSLEQAMWLGIYPLVFLLDALVRDWLYWRDFSLCGCKWGCSYLVTFTFLLEHCFPSFVSYWGEFGHRKYTIILIKSNCIPHQLKPLMVMCLSRFFLLNIFLLNIWRYTPVLSSSYCIMEKSLAMIVFGWYTCAKVRDEFDIMIMKIKGKARPRLFSRK